MVYPSKISKAFQFISASVKILSESLFIVTGRLLEVLGCRKFLEHLFSKMVTRKQSLTSIGAVLGFVGNSPGMVANQIRVLTLNNGENHDSTLYRLQKGWRLQFRLGPSLFGRKVTVYCNHPEGVEDEYIRNRYRPLKWLSDEDTLSGDDTSAYAEVAIRRAGSFHYYFVFDGSDGPGPQGSGFFTVDPVLTYGNDEVLPLDCIQCQTVLAKSLGPFHTWQNKLRVAKESGYNMIHFTPIQELGGSNSSYSLSDQHKLNPIFSDTNKEVTISDVEKFISNMRNEWKIVSICDIVLNHTANESQWLLEHPECTYNLVNSPHLRPSYLLDAVLHQLTVEVSEGKWEFSGIPSEVTCEEHLSAIRSTLLGYFLPQVKIPELYMLDIGSLVTEFYNLARTNTPYVAGGLHDKEQLKIIPHKEYHRLKATVDMELALKLYNVYRSDCFDDDARLRRCTEGFKQHIEQLNQDKFNEVQDHLHNAVENCVAGMRYFRVQHDGPHIKEVSIKNPLVPRYFTDYGHPKDLAEYEQLMYSKDSCFLMAHNGWVMNDDPLRNFAASDSFVYLRRELIAWGDSVKLRYGDKPEDCPFLWKYMQDYVEETARVFDGIRLDNCHSTPIPVAEFLLDAARRVRPDLYVAAELFTNSDQKDNIFVNRLGISSLIREAMSAWDSHEEGRLVYRYGGEPVGAFFQPSLRPLVPSIAHALFLDLTHDNPSPVDKRSVFDLLPSTALVSMACCASGSNRGYDELVPHHVYVDQMDTDIVAVTRHCPETHQTVVLVAYTAFSHPDPHFKRGFVKPLRVEGIVDEVILEATLIHKNSKSGGPRFGRPEGYKKHPKFINGLSDYEVEVREHIPVFESDILEQGESGDSNITQLNFINFQPGSVVAIRVSLHGRVNSALSKLRKQVSNFTSKPIPSHSELEEVVSRLGLEDLNRALYRCEGEERDESNGNRGAYDIPGFGPMVYCGLQDYISHRLKLDPGTMALGLWLQKSLEPLKELPRYLIPSYFDVIVSGTYLILLKQVWELMSEYHILGYAACLRHGLVPNLLDGGRNSRFNCRDAVWWWLYCIQSYVQEVPHGDAILSDKVSRIFPTDTSPAVPPGEADQPLYDVIQEALNVHFQGLCFRERNAGRSIDAHMTDKGFNNQIGVHPETGFVFGGNVWNCGTWMDKMGSSDKSGNRGKPATPRDGSAIELVGLSKGALRWLAQLNEEGKFPYDSVTRQKKDGSYTTWTYRQWEERIAANFEKHFFIPMTPSIHEPRPDLVHRRGIYKDSVNAGQPWADYQLRCNFPIAMVAVRMKTLDPADWGYHGDYDNSNDSDDEKLSHGFNYHQGPEWLWPVGFFLRAQLHFAREVGGETELQLTAAKTRAFLANHFTELQSTPWRGLPELTNKDGAYCKDSCRTQAWSMGCILEVLHDLQKLEQHHHITVNSIDN
ncbi:hypothetical protein C0J52_01523 [Blattella germanica]|nr:hypothetical protein C0J52_01523 [Blattella germanica]